MIFPIRINKYLAETNIASRRGADTLIEKGLVLINGRKAVLGDRVSEKDIVTVGKSKEKLFYFAYNKPIGVVTTTPQKGEQEILDIVKFPKGVFPVGRLDKDSHGLLIFTNDGRVTGKLLSPEKEHEKEYIVTLTKSFTETFLTKMSGGLKMEKYVTKKAVTKRVGAKKFSIILTEGKNRQIRKMCELLGYHVIDLIRVRVMNIELGKLKENTHRELTAIELKEFLKRLGL